MCGWARSGQWRYSTADGQTDGKIATKARTHAFTVQITAMPDVTIDEKRNVTDCADGADDCDKRKRVKPARR